MTVQMTVRIDDEAAEFVDAAVASGEGSRADVINLAIRAEMRRRTAAADALIYAATPDPELESDTYSAWAHANASAVFERLD